jgi:hypothetical protein
VLLLAIIVLVTSGVVRGDYTYSLWLGSHYTDFNDYGKKVGEYSHVYTDAYPEIGFTLFGSGENNYLSLNGQFYDNKNAFADLKLRSSNRFSMKVRYQTFRKQLQFDFLDNINAKEGIGSKAKMLSHEALDSTFDYSIDRHQAEAEFELMLAEKYDLKLIAAHRFILDKGDEQKTSISHCYSCHVSTKSAEVKKVTNQTNLGLEATKDNVSVGYKFSYRKFKSYADDITFFYDDARHPLNGGFVDEFGSRMIYDGEEMPTGIYPETEKYSSKVKFQVRNDKRRLNGSFSYSKTTNDVSNLDNVVVGGTVKFTTIVNPRLRFYANGALSKTTSNDVFYDLSAWREGGTGGDIDIFDYRRESSLDRLYGKGTARALYRMNPKTRVSVLLGYEHIRRYDYPDLDAETASNKYFGEGSIRFREGLKYTFSAKYKLELTSDPFVSYKGIFEKPGSEILSKENGAPHIYYYQRERDLKYQQITTLPTIKHEINLKGNYRVSKRVGLNAGLKLTMDENDELDSLTVEHTAFQPSVGIDVSVGNKWVLNSGYMYAYNKSTGPITVVMFDG